MKRLLFLLLFVGATARVADAGPPMQFVYFENFPPYSWMANGSMQGILIDVVDTVITEQLGIAVDHAGYPWKRAQKLVENGQADAFVTVPTPQRRAYTRISTEPVAVLAMRPFVHRDNPRLDRLRRITRLGDLQPFTSVHYIGNGWAETNLRGIKVYWVPTMDRAFYLLNKNKYDVYVGAADIVYFNLKRLGYTDNIVEIPVDLDAAPMHLCVGQHSPHLSFLPAFDKAMRNLRDSGQLALILARYR